MSLENGSASAAERTIACPASLALPRVVRTSSYADRGHGRHAFQNALFSGVPMERALAAVTNLADRETCRRIDWQKLCGDLENIETEVAYAIDVKARTARCLGKNIGRDYQGAAIRAGAPLGPYEVPGTLDIQGLVRGQGVRVVVDLKSGWQDVTEAERNAQLKFFAAVFQLLEERAAVQCRIAKLKGSGDIWNDTATFGAWEVDSYLDELEAALEASKESRRIYLAGGTPDVAEGSWCGYCDAHDACPGKTRLARSMLQDLGDIERRIEALSDEDAGRAFVKVHDRVLPLAERIQAALKERARRTPLPLSEAEELREAPYEKTNVNTEAMTELARRLGATDADIEKCERRVTIRPVKRCKKPTAKKLRRSA